jgi:hypothetical protein
MSSPAQQLSDTGFRAGNPERGRWRKRLLVLFWTAAAALGAAGIVAWQALDSLITLPLL